MAQKMWGFLFMLASLITDISVMIGRPWPSSQEGFLFYSLQKNTTDNKYMLWLFCGKH